MGTRDPWTTLPLSQWRVLLVAGMLLMAGCAGVSDPVGESNETTPAPSKNTTADLSDDNMKKNNKSESVGLREPVYPNNPFGKENLTVLLNHSADDRDMVPVVTQSLSYWENNSEEYAGYPISFELDKNTSDPDIEIVFVPSIDVCGLVATTTTTMGCAPVNNGSAVPETSTIRIAADHTQHTTQETVQHELGHALGLTHGDAPQEIMAETADTGRLRSDATVYVDRQAGAPHTVEREVDRALSFLEDGADGSINASPSFDVVDERSDADIIIEITADETACGPGHSSCLGSADRSGYQDQDVIVLTDVKPETIGWNIAYHLIAPRVDRGGMPEDFGSDADYDTRSDGWWH